MIVASAAVLARAAYPLDGGKWFVGRKFPEARDVERMALTYNPWWRSFGTVQIIDNGIVAAAPDSADIDQRPH